MATTEEADRAASADEAFIRTTTGLRSFLRNNKDRKDEPVGALYRLVYDHLRRHKIPSSGSVLKTKNAVQEMVDRLNMAASEGEGISPQDEDALADAVFALDNWKLIYDEFQLERESARALAGEDGMYVIAKAESPTAEFPVPTTKCVISTCRRVAVLGATRCEMHGGDWLAPEVRQALLLNAYEGLVKASDTAVATLLDVCLTSTRDEARVAAAREILDRAGIRSGVDINITVTPDVEAKNTLSRIRDRLDEMSESISAATSMVASSTESIVDAEVVSDDGTEPG